MIVSDSTETRAEIASHLSLIEVQIIEVASGKDVRSYVERHEPDLVISDMQVGSMGGYAIVMDLRLEESGGRQGHTPVLLLLDRRADVFLARRCRAEGYLVKPISGIRLRKAVAALLEGRTFEDSAFRPIETSAR
ncbi:Response regulator receiver domain-containing protein [Ferrithrix thermotolerans DSM 19514]|jgi:DNA-binding response OmpR family regulator|uniref:Response regulator receiver domain-containing protein n=2 Tax=Ferrithrix TaxID=643949 RepID=A0A1M4TEB7_9ACTN|nr:Response regulator receiver domain-containing protein [Ferrithrix thermotolerans DSM 19514]